MCSTKAPLVEIPLSDVLLWDESEDAFVGNVEGVPMGEPTPRIDGSDHSCANGSRDTEKTNDPKVRPSALLSRLDPNQRIVFLICGNASLTTYKTFILIFKVLNGHVISGLSDVLVKNQNRFPRSKMNLGHC